MTNQELFYEALTAPRVQRALKSTSYEKILHGAARLYSYGHVIGTYDGETLRYRRDDYSATTRKHVSDMLNAAWRAGVKTVQEVTYLTDAVMDYRHEVAVKSNARRLLKSVALKKQRERLGELLYEQREYGAAGLGDFGEIVYAYRVMCETRGEAPRV